ncbi:MAG: TonB-dependent receptor [Calditrichia bacterium]
MKGFFVYFVLLILMMGSALAQQPRQDGPGNITGTIYDSRDRVPIEYANIVLYNKADSAQITGTVSNPQGKFTLEKLRPGNYYIEIYFIGYRTKRIDNIQLRRPDFSADLGKIQLKQTALSADAIVVEGEKAAMTYKIDKKVINVSQQQTAISGSAVDVLENVPSVTVDIDGNVSLRGSGNFRVLIDGRPSILDPNDALDQIPASTIDNIEIITNPSAKYDPEGTAGIINVILKKNQMSGMSGLANLDGGLNDRYGGDFLAEYKNDIYTATISADYNRRFSDGSSRNVNRTTHADNTTNVLSNGDSRRGRISGGVKGSFALSPSPQDLISLDGRYGQGSHQRNSSLDYEQWTNPAIPHDIYTSRNNQDRSGTYYSANLMYQHRFALKGHEISGQLSYNHHSGDETALDELINSENSITSGRKSTEGGPSNEVRAKVDYSLPLGRTNKFEAGYQSELDRSQDNNTLSEYQTESDIYRLDPRFSHSTDYTRDVHAVYSMYSGELGRWGYQAGLRGEYTYRIIDLAGEGKRFTIDRWDYFPTLHMSYQFQKGQQMMASYTRRIDRPHGYYLEPFQTWMDAYNVRVGNPALKPEYIDSYEAGFQTYFGKNVFSTEFYYRMTHNKVERVRSVYDDNITLHSIENVGRDYSFGSEIMLNIDILRAWNLNLMGNLYNYRVEGLLYGDSFSRESFNWSTRINNSIKLGKWTQFQINGIYNSPTVSSQGRREGFFMTNFAVKHEILANQLSATLQVRDLFNTGRYEYTSEAPDLYTYSYHTHEAPIFMLNLRYNINNYKARPERNRDNSGGMDEGGGEEF